MLEIIARTNTHADAPARHWRKGAERSTETTKAHVADVRCPTLHFCQLTPRYEMTWRESGLQDIIVHSMSKICGSLCTRIVTSRCLRTYSCTQCPKFAAANVIQGLIMHPQCDVQALFEDAIVRPRSKLRKQMSYKAPLSACMVTSMLCLRT